MWERGWSFIKRAGTVILVSAIVIWFMQGYGWEARIPEDAMAADAEVVETVDAPVTFGAVENTDNSILGRVGSAVAPVFEPLGFGDWKPTVATVLGLVAKEEVVNVFGILYNDRYRRARYRHAAGRGLRGGSGAGPQPHRSEL